jgi:hypothetical protein
MNEDKVRRDLLTLWASDFLHGYRPDETDKEQAATLYSDLAARENVEGHRALAEDNPFEDDLPPMYWIGKAYAQKWGIPITQIGLTALILGCHTALDTEMLLAVVYKQFLRIKRTDSVLDSLCVSTILHEGTPTREYLDEMGKKQLIPGSTDGSVEPHDLMDEILSVDFL